MNPNKLNSSKYSSQCLPYDKFLMAIDKVQNELITIGIECNLIETGKIIRYDNSFDLIMENSYSCYMPAIVTMNPQGIRQGNKRIKKDTLYYGNKSQEICVYDKANEIEETNKNIIRFEYRHLKAKTLNIYLKNLSEEYYYKYRQNDKANIENFLFKVAPKIYTDNNDFLISTLQLINDVNLNKRQIESNLLVLALKTLEKNFEIPLDSLLRTPRKNNKIYRRNKLIKNDLSSKMPINKEYQNYFTEIKDKFKKVS
jgi:hypothetical protein